MFEESDFECDVDEEGKSLQKPVSSGEVVLPLALHRPGHPEFRTTCVPPNTNIQGRYDDRFMSGDAWGDHSCRCMQCELSTVMRTICQTQAHIVMLDLDNYGFNQLKQPISRLFLSHRNTKRQRCEPPPKANADTDPTIPSNIFFWCFFGSCFTRFHKTTPMEFLSSPESHESIWSALQRNHQCHFTPCAGHSQAADEVMKAIMMGLLADNDTRRCILVTNDVDLQTSCAQLGKDSKILSIIRPKEDGCESLVTFWRRLKLALV